MRFRVLLLLACCTFANIAKADDAEVRNAQTRFDEGKALAAKGQYDEPSINFVQAYAVLKSPDALYNPAYTESRSKHPVEAMQHFRKLLREPAVPADLSERVKKLMGDLEKTLAHVTVHAPDGADVSVDGVVAGRAPLADPVDVPPGSHTFGIALNGKAVARDLTAKEGESQDIALAFPDAKGPDNSGPINPPPDQTPKPTATRWIVGGSLIGLGAVGAAVGIGFLVDSAGASSDADRIRAQLGAGTCPTTDPPACMTLQSLRSRHDSDIAVGGVFVGVGAAALLGGVATLLLWPSAPTRAQVIPSVGPSRVGVTVLIRF